MKVQLIELQMCKAKSAKTSEEIQSNPKGKLSFVKKDSWFKIWFWFVETEVFLVNF